jgi:hypothetical protein
MLQDLAALTPPAIVCVAVLIGAWAIVRRELAPKRRQRAEAGAGSDEDRAVDPEHGRSLYFLTSAIYLAAHRSGMPFCASTRDACLRVAAEVRAVRLRT